jgi:uncharacterized caspase-like protein
MLFLLSVPLSLPALDFEVTAQTTDCSGDIGFSSFDSRDLYKMQSADCTDPNTGQKLQQVLLKSKSGLVSYDVIWVTQEEARNILQQIKEIKAAKIKRMTRPEVMIQKETVIRHERPIATPTVTRSAPPARSDLPGPVINIVDPPIANTRSITNVITPTDADKRTVVGKINAPAGLISLTINGKSHKVDEHGIFKAEVPVTRSKTPVTIVAVDNQGKRDTVEFRLLPEPLQEQPETGAGVDSDPSVFGNYHALIIANARYEKLDDLSTPKNDADAIADILKQRYGFTVTRLYDATRYEILSALNKTRRELTEKDNLLLYYAGHGEYDKTNNRGHWLPVDAETNSTANWISTVAITDILNAMSAKHVLVVADSCYSGALTRAVNTELDPGMSEETRMKWLRVIAKARSRYVLTSGGVKPVLDDSGNGHSMFANALINVLSESKGILEGSKLFREVKSRVSARAEELNVDQSPQYAQLKRTGHEFGEFLLVGQR